MRMKAVSYSKYYEGENVFQYRLRNALSDAGVKMHKIVQLRSNVYIVNTDRKKYLLKGFPNRKKYENQKLLVQLLKEKGFTNTYQFKKIPTFNFDGDTYAWIEYLSPQKEKFTFSLYENREKGLQLLEDFHLATRGFENQISVSRFNQLEKWNDRLREFERNKKVVRKYVDKSYIDSWLKYADFALEGMARFEEELYEEPLCIVHGDVAHHNFYYKKDGTLNIIDFDLISKAPPLIDYLQYCNRIMPNIKDCKELWTYKQLKKYKDNRAFLYALVYPTDLFREWNRIIKDNAIRNKDYMHSVWKLSVEQWGERLNLYKEITRRL